MDSKVMSPIVASSPSMDLVRQVPLAEQPYSIVPAVPSAVTDQPEVHGTVADNSVAGQILWLDPKPMVLHSARKSLPQLNPEHLNAIRKSIQENGLDPSRPVLVLPDRVTMLYGDDIRDAAVYLEKKTIPCCVVDPSDPAAFIVHQMVLNGRLTPDQQVYLAWQWRNQQSAEYRKRRARRAAAASHKMLTDDPDDLLDQPQFDDRNSRREAAQRFGVSEYTLRRLDEIEKTRPEELEFIRKGEKTIAAVTKKIKEAAEKKELDERREQAAELSETPEWIQGEPEKIITAAEETAGKLLILELMDPVQIDGILAGSLVRQLDEQHSLFAAATWETEAEVRRILEDRQYHVRERYIWNTGGSNPKCKDLISILWATYRDCNVKGEHSGTAYFSHSSTANRTRPVMPLNLYVELIERATIAGEIVVVPVAYSDAGVLAAHTTRRKIMAATADEQLYLTVKAKLAKKPVGGVK